ncbi:methylated-DNA--[protein]-cysteine S-methyltransferase [Halobacillus litoralis]|uniref:Methylated-DNA--protein-cysteine methyltransferase n=1 Tax=Halobacillus litoralis TaxID=45668 RepID=A0A845FED6_9BACI|nr:MULTISPECIES: methylated-DNA--[protein]-cysteine S-methyltransferase [Halobacillus]MBN9656509.1 methylated-DNA--[protein]-cysteine S-methyltransferase [Halobacillus sp. GSS1]MEC3885464.1 methylated-DNA--[protein]-cysteine S-methyltransferase [Halobacillus sp. HZG1]MYL72148.1 methylated-DNA--[protein]-cysteine S-methyltransferase [Halobacillus litoralis]
MNHQSFLYYDTFETPLGPMTVLANDEGVCRIDYGHYEDRLATYQSWKKKHFLKGELVYDPEHKYVAQTKQELTSYFEGHRNEFHVPLNCYGTDFQRQVWRTLLHHVPYGETRSYKDIAASMHAPKAIRAVGGAVNQNPFSIIVPCHRIIGSNGKLVGYAGGLDKKQKLLEFEKEHQTIKQNH